jgi:hypothetical protein
LGCYGRRFSNRWFGRTLFSFRAFGQFHRASATDFTLELKDTPREFSEPELYIRLLRPLSSAEPRLKLSNPIPQRQPEGNYQYKSNDQ